MPQLIDAMAGVLGPTLYLAVFSTVFAFWGRPRADSAGPNRSSRSLLLEPVIAALLSVFWLKEPMSARQALVEG